MRKKIDVVPAKAGTHCSAVPASEKWVPAFAGTTLILFVTFVVRTVTSPPHRLIVQPNSHRRFDTVLLGGDAGRRDRAVGLLRREDRDGRAGLQQTRVARDIDDDRRLGIDERLDRAVLPFPL